jgi:hypothetical protein
MAAPDRTIKLKIEILERRRRPRIN